MKGEEKNKPQSEQPRTAQGDRPSSQHVHPQKQDGHRHHQHTANDNRRKHHPDAPGGSYDGY